MTVHYLLYKKMVTGSVRIILYSWFSVWAIPVDIYTPICGRHFLNEPHKDYTTFHQYFGSDITSVSFAFNWVGRASSHAKMCSAEIRCGANTEQALIFCDVTSKVLLKCRISAFRSKWADFERLACVNLMGIPSMSLIQIFCWWVIHCICAICWKCSEYV